MFLRKISFNRQLTQTSIFWIGVVCVSFTAGFLGGAISQDKAQVSSSLDMVRPVILQDKTRGSSPFDAFTDENLSQMRTSMLAVHDDVSQVSVSQSLAALPTEQSLRGFALALTTDGWLVTTVPIEKSQKSYRLIAGSGKVYSVTSVISDAATGVSFIKINAKNLRPIQFSKFTDQPSLRHALIVSGWGGAEYVIVARATYPPPRAPSDYVHSTQVIDKRFLPERSFDLYCLPVLSSSLEVLGCTSSTGVVSFEYLQSALQAVLRTGMLPRTLLSLQYIDLSQAPTFLEASENPQFGAYLKLETGRRSLTLSNGTEEILTDGDTITHVNDHAVDATRNLSELLAVYQKGEQVSLRIHSKKGNRDIQIKL